MECETVSVSNSLRDYTNGEYQYLPDTRVSWALDKPVYKHLERNRYIFWTEGKGYGTQWVIEDNNKWTTGSYSHKSKSYFQILIF